MAQSKALSKDEARFVRYALQNTDLGQRTLAQFLNVSQMAVSRVNTGATHGDAEPMTEAEADAFAAARSGAGLPEIPAPAWWPRSWMAPQGGVDLSRYRAAAEDAVRLEEFVILVAGENGAAEEFRLHPIDPDVAERKHADRAHFAAEQMRDYWSVYHSTLGTDVEGMHRAAEAADPGGRDRTGRRWHSDPLPRATAIRRLA